MAGNLPLLPHLLIVKGETLSTSATSFTVNKSGRSSSETLFGILKLFISHDFRGCQAGKLNILTKMRYYDS